MDEQHTEATTQNSQEQAEAPRARRSRRATAPVTEPTTADQPETGAGTAVGGPDGDALDAVAEKAAEAAAVDAPARTTSRRRTAKSASGRSGAKTTRKAGSGAAQPGQDMPAQEPQGEEPAEERQDGEGEGTQTTPTKPTRARAPRKRAAKKTSAPVGDEEPAASGEAGTIAEAGGVEPASGEPAQAEPGQAEVAEIEATHPAPGAVIDESEETTRPAANDATDAPVTEAPPAGRSRRRAPKERAREQELDVLAELGLSQPEDDDAAAGSEGPDESDAAGAAEPDTGTEQVDEPRLPAAALLFQAPDPSSRPRRRRAQATAGEPTGRDRDADEAGEPEDEATGQGEDRSGEEESGGEGAGGGRRRRRRGGRGRRNRGSGGDADDNRGDGDDSADGGRERSDSDKDGRDRKDSPDSKSEKDATETAGRSADDRRDKGAGDEAQESGSDEADGADSRDDGDESSSSSRRRRRRRRSRNGDGDGRRDEVTALKGSTRLEAKRQRRREGREAGRRRTTLSEAEFLARRESVERKMIVREKDGLNQIAVLEDDILVEHYVARHTQTSMVGNVYLGRVQNVLPSMEAAFVDLGKGRNAVLYAGEVNWDAAGMEGQPRRIEQALKSGDTVLVQVTKDPIGHKGARLTSQITLAGRHLVLVPSGGMTGISRKLPDNERSRLKKLLKEIVPEGAGVIVRTAAEGATEEQLRADVERLTKQWADIDAKAKNAKSAPTLLKGEPELAVRVVRDVFNEDFQSLVVAGDTAWKTISTYVRDLSPELADRMHHWTATGDVFAEHRVDEQLAKAMDRKVWLPSGGSLIIERTEAMTVIDVNTGKFTGSGGTLEETVTKNNLEAAEEIVRQLRLRDIGGIIVIDFIDMVLESNRDLVLRRLLECLGRDRTRHQVAEVTSLGLVQMTRKRVGQGLIEAFSTPCEHCGGRGFVIHDHPVEKSGSSGSDDGGGRRRGRRGSTPQHTSPASPPEAPAEDPGAAKAREEVKATLATIAAAAASAHEHDTKSADESADADRNVSTQDPHEPRTPAAEPVSDPAEPATPEDPPATGVVGAPAGGSVVVPSDAQEAAETADRKPAAEPHRRPRRSRRAVSSGVVTPGETSIITIDPAQESGSGSD